MRPHVTLLMRGSQTLAELRDAIFCVSDLQVCGEFSNTPDLAPDFICKDLFRSAFFFFEGVFYDDMRHPDCQDISRSIFKWKNFENSFLFSQCKHGCIKTSFYFIVKFCLMLQILIKNISGPLGIDDLLYLDPTDF
uniref:snRNA-activating protein complex subunit 3 n=1 Tax=Cyprinodon variegatus TaxID=28743 RepID=A0A3Q2CCV5_CYPVA